jgi:hypothetical protein
MVESEPTQCDEIQVSTDQPIAHPSRIVSRPPRTYPFECLFTEERALMANQCARLSRMRRVVVWQDEVRQWGIVDRLGSENDGPREAGKQGEGNTQAQLT